MFAALTDGDEGIQRDAKIGAAVRFFQLGPKIRDRVGWIGLADLCPGFGGYQLWALVARFRVFFACCCMHACMSMRI